MVTLFYRRTMGCDSTLPIVQKKISEHTKIERRLRTVDISASAFDDRYIYIHHCVMFKTVLFPSNVLWSASSSEIGSKSPFNIISTQ